jgi:hypothetical protein
MCGAMKAVSIPGGYAALVDDEDFELVSEYEWYAVVTKDKTGIGAYDLRGRAMDRLTMRAKPWQIVEHVNKNSLDNQKRNLHVKTRPRKRA